MVLFKNFIVILKLNMIIVISVIKNENILFLICVIEVIKFCFLDCFKYDLFLYIFFIFFLDLIVFWICLRSVGFFIEIINEFVKGLFDLGIEILSLFCKFLKFLNLFINLIEWILFIFNIYFFILFFLFWLRLFCKFVIIKELNIFLLVKFFKFNEKFMKIFNVIIVIIIV